MVHEELKRCLRLSNFRACRNVLGEPAFRNIAGNDRVLGGRSALRENHCNILLIRREHKPEGVFLSKVVRFWFFDLEEFLKLSLSIAVGLSLLEHIEQLHLLGFEKFLQVGFGHIAWLRPSLKVRQLQLRSLVDVADEEIPVALEDDLLFVKRELRT